ncbi:coiled-coil domain-containing protein 43 [Zootermopsis nevadensis]|uniref:Coiled-coil domain-containing protein 43 n=1 Tax=Zootermopsis nevadensis TaxID=136037 RepID=A0A067R7C6_ZOONE|nr:coiled-coil domain-containing protein 43 [Zootermopsis nevadensis]KDR18361.1 Coiled-coil domain-containing protein 43 [Zootermopsis nevadensis]
MAAGGDDFESWLSLKLRALNTDEGVFGSYIRGILEGEETLEDKTEALEGILSEITEDDIPTHCREILVKWKSVSQTTDVVTVNNADSGEDMDVKLVRLLESQPRPTTVQRTYTEEERKIREAILAQYSQMSDQDDDDEADHPIEGKENGLVKNTNSAVVQQAEKEKREKAKLESQKKKEKDKEDREKQKQQQQERKEKRKTQKGERRR